MFRASVERWRSLAASTTDEIAPSHILALIQRESGGEPGLIGKSGDLGLMQCHPLTLQSYNDAHPTAPISREQMTGRTSSDTAAQVRCGVWYLRRCLAAVAAIDPARFPWPARPPTDDHLRFSDLCYSAGVQAFKSYRAAVLATGAPDSFEALADAAPGPPSLTNPRHRIPPRKFAHARAVLHLTRTDGGSAPQPPIISYEPQPTTSPAPFAALALIALLAFGLAHAEKSRRFGV